MSISNATKRPGPHRRDMSEHQADDHTTRFSTVFSGEHLFGLTSSISDRVFGENNKKIMKISSVAHFLGSIA
jgi:hypothetical protein